MNFQRGIDPKTKMEVGAASIAIRVMDMVRVNFNEVTGHSNGMTNVSHKETHGMFKQLAAHPTITQKRYKHLRKYYRPRKVHPDREHISWADLLGKFVLLDGEIYKMPITSQGGNDLLTIEEFTAGSSTL